MVGGQLSSAMTTIISILDFNFGIPQTRVNSFCLPVSPLQFVKYLVNLLIRVKSV